MGPVQGRGIERGRLSGQGPLRVPAWAKERGAVCRSYLHKRKKGIGGTGTKGINEDGPALWGH